MNDLISRKAAIDALGERPMVWTDDDQYTLGERNQYDIDRLAIETLPSAQPERKNGKWIKQNPMVDTEECSECGYNILGEEFETPFCPICGARLMGEEDDDRDTD